MADFDRILAIKKAAQARLFAIPGVHAVGIGAKKVGGKRTSEPAIVVLLVKKKLLSEVAANQLIPPEIDGVKTDVIEAGVPHLCTDTQMYRPVEGGISIRAGWLSGAPIGGFSIGAGTIGCIAVTNDTPPKIGALTCHHVVAGVVGNALHTLDVALNSGAGTITFSGPSKADARNIVVVLFANYSSTPQTAVAIYNTAKGDSLNTIAAGVSDAINKTGRATATVQGATINFTITDSSVAVARVLDPLFQLPTDLEVSVTRDSTTKAITISVAGKTAESGDMCVFTSFNLGTSYPTYGVFTAAKMQTDATAVATDIKASLSSLITALTLANPALTGLGLSVTLDTSGTSPKIIISGAEEVECWVTGDTRVGQPDANFSPKCCPCWEMRIGTIHSARLDVDAALIQLDDGISAKAEIEGIGVVQGAHILDDTEVNGDMYKVQLRGQTTDSPNTSTIHLLHVDGLLASSPSQSASTPTQVFSRYYTEAMSINSFTDVLGHQVPLGEEGDSGAAVVSSMGSDAGKVVGIFFGREPLTNYSFATPIKQIMDALDVTVATPVDLADALSQRETTRAATLPAASPAIARGGAGLLTRATNTMSNQLRSAEQELSSTPAGKKYVDVVRRHLAEAQTLINTNRRVATVWQRSGGPQILNSLLRMVQFRDQSLPADINSVPLADCLGRIQKTLVQFASPALSADLTEYLPKMAKFAGLTYPQILATLQSSDGD